MDSQSRENDVTHTCLAMVPYIGGASAVVTTNYNDDGLHALTLEVQKAGKLTVEGWFQHFAVWREQKIWRVGGNATPEEFFAHGPFTRNRENGRPSEEGNFVVLSYFKPVVQSFCLSHHLVYYDFQQTLWSGTYIPCRLDKGSYATAVVAGWGASTPLWASMNKQPDLVKSNTKYLHGIYWKMEHPLLLPYSWSREQTSAIGKMLQSTLKKVGKDDSVDGDWSSDNSEGTWVGGYIPAEAEEFDRAVKADAAIFAEECAGGGHDGGSGRATVPVDISSAVMQSVEGLFPRKRGASEADLDTHELFGTAGPRDDEDLSPADRKAAEDFYGGVVAVQCDWCEKWRFVVPSVHGDRFTERAQTEDPVFFQCFQLTMKDGKGCGVTCETPSQKFRPPNPNDPGERLLALETRHDFLTWARTHLDAEDFLVPGNTVEEQVAGDEFYREHYWRFLWFSQDIVPEGKQGTDGAFDAKVDAVQGTFYSAVQEALDERPGGPTACPGSTGGFRHKGLQTA